MCLSPSLDLRTLRGSFLKVILLTWHREMEKQNSKVKVAPGVPKKRGSSDGRSASISPTAVYIQEQGTTSVVTDARPGVHYHGTSIITV